ncbi:MAG: LDL receptor domain-containing protein [Myxococcota bacterium]
MKRPFAPGPWLLIVVGAALGSCAISGIFESTGAPCRDDANCPAEQSCCRGHCARTCESGDAVVASVTLSTDFVPGYEFDEVRVELDDDVRAVDANVTAAFFFAAPVGQFFEVAPDREHRVVVALRSAGSTVAERTVAFTPSADVVVPVVLSRDCTEVVCGAADQCLGARCESEQCFGLEPSACLAPLCASDVDCPALVACTRGVCTSGVCLQQRDDSSCGADERCLPGVGCMAREVECDDAADCEDNYSCTREGCDRGRCVVTAEHASCEDDTICAPGAIGVDPVTGCAPRPTFACATSGQTIPLEWRCDGFANCFDHSDEQGCGYALFTCANETQAIRADWACDAFVNCPDQSDETDCGYEAFVCANGFNVTRQEWVCDGSTTCPDFSDEADCGYALFTCANGVRAIRAEWRCDAFVNCEDGSDEIGCP